MEMIESALFLVIDIVYRVVMLLVETGAV